MDEAVRVFGSSGYNGGSLRSIAERVGVSPGTINRHFASKEDLLNAVLERWSEDVATAIDESSQVGISVLHALRAGMAYHEEHPHLLSLFLLTATEAGAGDHPGRPFMRTRYSDLLGRYEESLRRAVQDGEIAPLDEASIAFEARAIVAFADGIEIQYLLAPDFSLVGAFDDYWERCLQRWGARHTA
ncbi:TetR/AcrR family transcriptional regulator [Brachybacterium saurashtrense]|uniref:TetR/AcrR family transcriptional regulator n=1 Tax=Brachybacterium saurashtrense TaxID=556288 RepID=UPI0013B376B8|nr:TetR/AcrR family transcriptional regulator [Brachybacterium saurashtrense]